MKIYMLIIIALLIAGCKPDYEAKNDEDMRVSQLDTTEIDSLKKIALLAFKEERILELWDDDKKEYVKTYYFTGYSGTPGPKLREGDRQIPEGEYKVVLLNPHSKYHLSFKLNYPNEFDLEKAGKEGRDNPGGEIFIHGGSETVGCIPIGDEMIEELYGLVERVGINNVRVLIFPNDIRGGGNFVRERQNPPWISELYGSLKIKLKDYRKSE